MSKRFRLLDVVRDPGGTHRCRECKNGLLFHLYSDDGMDVLGLTCHLCDYTRELSRPFPVEETHHV
jgi:hypothetical protein